MDFLLPSCSSLRVGYSQLPGFYAPSSCISCTMTSSSSSASSFRLSSPFVSLVFLLVLLAFPSLSYSAINAIYVHPSTGPSWPENGWGDVFEGAYGPAGYAVFTFADSASTILVPDFNGILFMDGSSGASNCLELQDWVNNNSGALDAWLTNPSYTRALYLNSNFGSNIYVSLFDVSFQAESSLTLIVSSADFPGSPPWNGPFQPTIAPMEGNQYALGTVSFGTCSPTTLLYDTVNIGYVVLQYCIFAGRVVIAGGITDPFYHYGYEVQSKNYFRNLFAWAAPLPSPSTTTSSTPSASTSSSVSITASFTPTYSITPSYTPSSSRSPSFTPTTSRTPSVSSSSSVTPSFSVTPSSSVSRSRTASPTPTSSMTASSSITPSVTPSSSRSSTPSVTGSNSVTPSSSGMPSISTSRSSSVSLTPSQSISISFTPSISFSRSSTRSATFSVFRSSSISISGSISHSISISKSISISSSNIPSIEPSSSRTPRRSEALPPSKTPPSPPPPPPPPPSSPTPTAKPGEQVEFEDEDGEEVTVTFCPDPKLPFGCNGKCVNSLTLCTDDGEVCSDPKDCPDSNMKEDEEVVKIDVVITDKDVTVPVVGSKGGYLGSVDVPKGAFEKGTVIRVQTFNGTLPEEEKKKNSCGEEESADDIRLSGLYDITALQPSGSKSKFNKPVTVGQLAVLPEGTDPEDVCIAYNPGEGAESKWTCERDGVRYEKVGKNTYLFFKDYEHFTGFSVLLGDTDGDGCGEDFSTIQWLSVSFLIAAGLVITVVCVVYWIYQRREYAKTMATMEQLRTTKETL